MCVEKREPGLNTKLCIQQNSAWAKSTQRRRNFWPLGGIYECEIRLGKGWKKGRGGVHQNVVVLAGENTTVFLGNVFHHLKFVALFAYKLIVIFSPKYLQKSTQFCWVLQE
jgi:hypothetical protein